MGVPMLVAAGFGGAAASALGAYEGGQATKEAMAYKAQVALNNAAIAKRNAAWDMQAGEAAASAKGLQTRAKVASQEAVQGAAGVTTTVGSAPAVRAGTEMMGMADALTIRSNAAKQAYGEKVAATSFEAESRLDTAEGQQAALGGEFGAAGSLLSGASTTGGNYAAWQKAFG